MSKKECAIEKGCARYLSILALVTAAAYCVNYVKSINYGRIAEGAAEKKSKRSWAKVAVVILIGLVGGITAYGIVKPIQPTVGGITFNTAKVKPGEDFKIRAQIKDISSGLLSLYPVGIQSATAYVKYPNGTIVPYTMQNSGNQYTATAKADFGTQSLVNITATTKAGLKGVGFSTGTVVGGVSSADIDNYINSGGSFAFLNHGYWKALDESGKEAALLINYLFDENATLTDSLNASLNGDYRLLSLCGKLVKYVPEIEKYPLAIQAGALQIDSIVYGNGFDTIKGDDYVWSNLVKPAIGYIVQLQDNGKIKCLRYGDLGLANKSLELESVRQVLLPIQLMTINMTSGEWGFTLEKLLDVAVYNVSPNKNLNNLSPCEWIRGMALSDYIAKSWPGPYSNAINYVYRGAGAGSAFPNSMSGLINGTLIIMNLYGDFIPFLYGYPTYLRGHVAKMLPEQGVQEYNVILNRLFGIPTFVYTAIYPNSTPDRTGEHDEPAIIVSDVISQSLARSGKLILPNHYSLWLYRDLFNKDYERKTSKPYLKREGADGIYREVYTGD